MFNRNKMNTGFMCELSIITEPADSISAKLDTYACDFLATKERKISVSASFMLDFICVPLSRMLHEAQPFSSGTFSIRLTLTPLFYIATAYSIIPWKCLRTQYPKGFKWTLNAVTEGYQYWTDHHKCPKKYDHQFSTVTKDQTETQFKEGVFIWAHGFRYFSPWRQGGYSWALQIHDGSREAGWKVAQMAKVDAALGAFALP